MGACAAPSVGTLSPKLTASTLAVPANLHCAVPPHHTQTETMMCVSERSGGATTEGAGLAVCGWMQGGLNAWPPPTLQNLEGSHVVGLEQNIQQGGLHGWRVGHK
jgi:hypothetical protein